MKISEVIDNKRDYMSLLFLADECVEALYMGIEAIKEQPKRGKWID